MAEAAGEGAGAGGGAACAAAGAELCDGRDNDCDGQTDERADLLARGVVGGPCGAPGDACASGVVECRDGGLRCLASASPTAETCNGRDDDCDGDTDEGFDKGRRCALGEGPCRREDVTVCAPDGAGVVCGATPGPPAEEVCNGVDDDCDGVTDDGDFGGAPCEVGLGQCVAAGVLVCAGVEGLVCGATPHPAGRRDVCDGRDEDCDGVTDEDFDVGAFCLVGAGACQREGVVACTPRGDAACGARPGVPSPELCNGVDDDCDGATDEEFEAGELCSIGRGRCFSQGVWLCAEGGGRRCTADPIEPLAGETCNGVDDNCDGRTDEGFRVGDPCEVGIGECGRAGLRACNDEGFAQCDAVPGPPFPERCDGLDNDCDTNTDEGFSLGAFCRVGLGECLAVGETICAADQLGVACSVAPLPAAAEVCDGLDNDCDGQTDEVAAEARLDLPVVGPVDAVALSAGPAVEGLALAVVAGDELWVARWDCAYAPAWDAVVPLDAGCPADLDPPAPLPDGGLGVLVDACDAELMAVDAGGLRWREFLGDADEVSGVCPVAGDRLAVLVGDEIEVLDAQGGPADRFALDPAGADGPVADADLGHVPAGGPVLAFWTDGHGDGVLRRYDPAAAWAEAWTLRLSGGGARLAARVAGVAPDGSALLLGTASDAQGSAAWVAVVEAGGGLRARRGSPFYDGCVQVAFAPAPVARCLAPARLLWLDSTGAVLVNDPRGVRAVVGVPGAPANTLLAASQDAQGIVIRRISRP